MATYIILMNMTEQGVKNVRSSPERVEDAAKALEAAGGKLLDFFIVTGPYDYVAIAEAPNDEIALAQLLGLGMAGNVRTTSLKAFSRDEFARVLELLP